MAELKFEVLFTAIDRLSGTIKRVGTAFTEMNEKMKATGENMVKAGAGLGAAGIAGGVGLRYFIDAGIEASGEIARVSEAMNDGADTAKNLAEMNEFVDKTAEQGVISTKNLRGAYYTARSYSLSHADALAAVAASADAATAGTENADAANAAMIPTIRTLSGLSRIYHEDVHKLADEFTLLQTRHAFENINEINDALKYAAPVAKQMHVGTDQLSASIAVLSENMQTAGMAGTITRNVLTEFAKGGAHGRLIPFTKTDAAGNFLYDQSLIALLGHLKTLTPVEQSRFLANAGFQARTIAGIEVLVNNTEYLAQIEKESANSVGAANKLALQRQQAADEQLAKFTNSWQVLRETIGIELLPIFTKWLTKLNEGLPKLIDWVKGHAELIKSIGKWVAVGSVVLVVLGVVTALAGSLLILAAFIGAVGGAFSIVGAGIIAALAVIGVFVYGLYTHFDKIKAAMKTLGKELIKLLGEGLVDGLYYLTAPLAAIGHFIMDHFKGHSPPPLGPLHELDRVNIIETIARTIRPVALATPLGLAAGYFAEQALGGAGFRGGPSIVINLNYHPTFNGAISADIDPKKHADVIARELRNQLARHERLSYH